jgi:hypothetical protein
MVKQSLPGTRTKMYAHSLTENLPAIIVLHDSADLIGCSIRLDNLVLAFQPLPVPLPVLLFYSLVVLDRFHEFRLDQPRLKTKAKRWMDQPPETRGTLNNSAHLLLLDLAITTRTSFPLQSLDPPLERVTESASVRHEILQLRRISLAGGFIGGVD